MQVAGIVQAGHRVASGQAPDSPYAQGTIALQTPHFLALGLDIRPYFQGTINISIKPYQFNLLNPSHRFRQLKWHPDFPPEDFSFAPCQLSYQDIFYPSLLYYPHPESKINHFQDPSILEVLAPQIQGLNYGDRVSLELAPQVIELFEP